MSDQMSFPVKECPFCGNGEDYVDGAYQHKLVHCHFCGETIKLETWQSRPIEDGLRAELARRDEQIAELTATTHSQAVRNAELSRFVWWVYQVYARNVQELTSGITEACTYETEEKAEKGKYGLPIRCWEYIRYLEEYTAGIYNGTYLDSETSTVVKRDLSDAEINELGAQEAERKEFCPNCEAETPCTHEAELEELLNTRNMETNQFNDGFNDARAGKLETDHPHYDLDTDNWRLGYAWGMFEPMKEKLARERQVSDALYMLLVDDPNTKFKAEQILIDIYGKCEPSPSDVSMTESVLMDIKTGKSVEIEELETVVEHLQIRLSEWRGVARQLADELKEEISSKCTVIWEDVGETSPAWIAYNNLVDTEDYETNPDYYKGV